MIDPSLELLHDLSYLEVISDVLIALVLVDITGAGLDGVGALVTIIIVDGLGDEQSFVEIAIKLNKIIHRLRPT